MNTFTNGGAIYADDVNDNFDELAGYIDAGTANHSVNDAEYTGLKLAQGIALPGSNADSIQTWTHTFTASDSITPAFYISSYDKVLFMTMAKYTSAAGTSETIPDAANAHLHISETAGEATVQLTVVGGFLAVNDTITVFVMYAN